MQIPCAFLVILLDNISAVASGFSIPDGQPRGLYIATIDKLSDTEIHKRVNLPMVSPGPQNPGPSRGSSSRIYGGQESSVDEDFVRSQPDTLAFTPPMRMNKEAVTCLPSDILLPTSALVAWASLSNSLSLAEHDRLTSGDAVYYIENRVITYMCIEEQNSKDRGSPRSEGGFPGNCRKVWTQSIWGSGDQRRQSSEGGIWYRFGGCVAEQRTL